MAAPTCTWTSRKQAVLNGMLPTGVKNFNLDRILDYFVKVKSDAGSAKGVAYQLFKRGFVQVSAT